MQHRQHTDILIIGAGASGLFFTTHAPKHLSKTILETSPHIAQKVLLSWGERCNVSNIYTSPDHYTGTQKQALHSLFAKFSAPQMQARLADHDIETKTEDNGRIILKSEKSRHLVNLLIKKAESNNAQILTNHTVIKIEKNDTENNTGYKITTNNGEFSCSSLIIASGWISFPQLGATSLAREVAKQFWIKTKEAYHCLCGIETKENLSPITGNSIETTLSIHHGKKTVFENQGKLLFTHRGFSGPLIFNASVAIGDQEITGLTIGISPKEKLAPKIENHLKSLSKDQKILIHPKSFRPLTEAKVTGWGILLHELTPFFEAKKSPELYFLGECIDITGETWGFNLQRCRTSARNCAQKFSLNP